MENVMEKKFPVIKNFNDAWNEACEPFRTRVEWCKEGGKKLGMRKKVKVNGPKRSN